MSRTVYVFRDGEWVDRDTARPLHASRPAHGVISDGMDAIQSMADGKMYDSKSNYYRDLKARGYEVVGNERPAFDKAQPREFQSQGVEQSIKRAMAQHGWGD